MNHLSTDIGSQIGALELGGDLESVSDGGLESAGLVLTGGHTMQAACTMIRCIGDGALEAAGTNLAPATYPVPVTVCCTRIDDDALEAAGSVVLGPATSIAMATNCCNFPH